MTVPSSSRSTLELSEYSDGNFERTPIAQAILQGKIQGTMNAVAAVSSTVDRVRMLAAQSSGVVAVKVIGMRCSTCPMVRLCPPSDVDGVARAWLNSIKFARRKVKAGQMVYCEGEQFQYVHAVRSGTLKSSLTVSGGREQVSGFHLSGELVGLDGVANGHHASAAMALEDSELCAIPYAHLSDLAVGTSGMQHIISRMMCREILRKHSLLMLLGSMAAEERLAAFLLNLSQRYAVRGYSEREFHLRMSRAEIASYLGLKLETVSRAFSAFRQQRLLEVDKRHIRNIDLEGLRRFVVRVH